MSCTAAWNQKTFRGRNDDGNETTATWKANQSVNFSQAKDTNFRIRFEIQETAACAGANKVWQLQYNRNGAGWNNVTGASSVVRSTASPNLADAANCTNQLTAGTGTFIGATGFDEVNGQAGGSSMDVAASGHSETEFCVQIRSADVASGDTIQLRATDNGTAFAAYDATPSITVSSGNVTVTPDVVALTTSTFAPVIKHQIIVPVKALTTATFAPTIQHKVIIPVKALTTATFAPTVTTTANQLVTPTTAALVLTGFAPVIALKVIPGTAALTTTAFAPTVTATQNITVTPTTLALTATGFAPTVSAPRLVTPGTLALVTTGFAPTVTASAHQLVTPVTTSLVLATFIPTITVSGGEPEPEPEAPAPTIVRAGGGGRYESMVMNGPSIIELIKKKKKQKLRQMQDKKLAAILAALDQDDLL